MILYRHRKMEVHDGSGAYLVCCDRRDRVYRAKSNGLKNNFKKFEKKACIFYYSLV